MNNYKLVLLRHGESEWNALNLFTGWVDVGLSEKGAQEAVYAGQLLRETDLLPTKLHTSLLRRAIQTANSALDECDRLWIPVERSWRLNERHYGNLQGMNKTEIREKYGEKKFMEWRRSYDIPPPEIADDSKFSQANDLRYRGEPIPKTESLKLVLERALPYWKSHIIPDLKQHPLVLVTAHGNSLRALVKHLDNLSDSEISGLNLPTGIPLFYELDAEFKPVHPGGEYLDPEAAQASIAAVANQGKK
jgi:2,3-bisphosphoglycerate-dependent phosphoglycerate mutase